MLAWPSISETILGLTLRESKSVAHVCRRSWKRVSAERPACFRSRAKERLRRFEGLIMRANLVGEDKAAGLVEGAQPIHLLHLALQVALEGCYGARGEAHGAAALLGLGLRQGVLAPRAGKGAPDLERARFEVQVLPLEGQQLALPQSCVYGQHVESFETVTASGFNQAICLFTVSGVISSRSIRGSFKASARCAELGRRPRLDPGPCARPRASCAP